MRIILSKLLTLEDQVNALKSKLKHKRIRLDSSSESDLDLMILIMMMKRTILCLLAKEPQRQLS